MSNKETEITTVGSNPDSEKNFQNLQNFLGEATSPIRDPGDTDYSDKKQYFPPVGNQNIKAYNRPFEVVGKYVGTDATLKEIGDSQPIPITRERVRQIVVNTVRRLHNSVPLEIQNQYPFESFGFGKPPTRINGQRNSEAHGGITNKVVELIEKGVNPDELKSTFKSPQLYSARKSIDRWIDDDANPDSNLVNAKAILDVIIEKNREMKIPLHLRFAKIQDPDATDQEIQKALNSIHSHQIKRLENSGLISSLSHITRESGVYMKSHSLQQVSEVLSKAGIPQASIPLYGKDSKIVGYYKIIAFKHKNTVIDILQNAEELKDYRTNPVRQISGTKTDALPNTNDLINNPDCYGLVSYLIAQALKLKSWSNNRKVLKTKNIIEGLPYTLFQHNRSIYYQKSDETEVKAYIEMRLKELAKT